MAVCGYPRIRWDDPDEEVGLRPAGFTYTVDNAKFRYLQAQNLMTIPTYISFIVAPVNIGLNLLLVSDKFACLIHDSDF